MRDPNKAFKEKMAEACELIMRLAAEEDWDSELAGSALIYCAATLARLSGVDRFRFLGKCKEAYQRCQQIDMGKVLTEEDVAKRQSIWVKFFTGVASILKPKPNDSEKPPPSAA